MSSKDFIDKKTLEHLAELGRIEIGDKRQAISDKEEKLLKDLQKILGHFEELKEVDTENINPVRSQTPSVSADAQAHRTSNGVEPMGGGAELKNVFREDEFVEAEKRGNENLEADLRGKLVSAFPEKENGFLKVPPVFEK
ncbi:MAG: Asp-tRNA(Asn)/Glu-tRNA(Gln) amidotransferase subunit GatC [Patescibacteria group bacterium]